MYIDPFIAGILATILVEAVGLLIVAYFVGRRKR